MASRNLWGLTTHLDLCHQSGTESPSLVRTKRQPKSDLFDPPSSNSRFLSRIQGITSPDASYRYPTLSFERGRIQEVPPQGFHMREPCPISGIVGTPSQLSLTRLRRYRNPPWKTLPPQGGQSGLRPLTVYMNLSAPNVYIPTFFSI